MTAQATGWPRVRKEFTETTYQLPNSNVTARVYQPLKRPYTYSMDCFLVMIDNFFDDMQSTAQEHAQGTKMVGLNFETTKTRFAKYVNQIKDSEKLFPKTEEKVRFGLTHQEQTECLQKAKDVAVKWFDGKSTANHNEKRYWMAPTDQILDKSIRLDPEMMRFFYKEFKLRASKDPLSFSKADREAFELTEDQKLIDPTKMSCFVFAFMRIREIRIKEYLLEDKEFPEDFTELLTSWGYKPVEGAPQENDLVQYINARGQSGHLGRFLASGLVESKLGINQPRYHWHNLPDVSPVHGDRWVFWRRA